MEPILVLDPLGDLDFSGVIRELERYFSVRFEISELEVTPTIGRLHQLILRKTGQLTALRSLSRPAFRLVQSAIRQVTGDSNLPVHPSDSLPARLGGGAVRLWPRLCETLHIPIASLRFPPAVRRAIFYIPVLTGLAAFVVGGFGETAAHALGLGVSSASIALFATLLLSLPLQRYLPIRSVRVLTYHVVAAHFDSFSHRFWPEPELRTWQEMVAIVACELGTDPRELIPPTRFVGPTRGLDSG